MNVAEIVVHLIQNEPGFDPFLMLVKLRPWDSDPLLKGIVELIQPFAANI